MTRFAVDMAFVAVGVALGFILGSAVRARRDRARAARLATLDRLIAPRNGQVEALMDAVFGPPHRGVYRAPPS